MLGSANVCWLATAGSPLKRCSFIHGPYQSSGCHNLPEWEKCSMLLAEESVSTVISNFEGYSFLDRWHFGLPYYYLSSAFTHMQVKICFPLKLALKNQSSEKNNPFSFSTLSSGIQLLWQYPIDLLAGPVQTVARACQLIGILLISSFKLGKF